MHPEASDSAAEPVHVVKTQQATASVPLSAGPQTAPARAVLWVLAALALLACMLAGSLYLKLSNIQEALARQSSDATAAALEARALAKAAQETVKDISARQMLLETKLAEVAVQRSQLDDLIQSLSRSRDENLVVDMDSALRLAQQQANLTGSLEPLIAALRSAEQRVQRSGQPRLTPLLRALVKDIDRVKTSNVADTPSLLIKLDELVRLVDELPLANAVATSSAKPVVSTLPTRDARDNALHGAGGWLALPPWLQQLLGTVRQEVRSLVRVSRIDTPEAALLSPEQSFFARENLKLKLLNARLALLSRQFVTARNDLADAAQLTTRYFDANARVSVQAASLLAQLQTQLRRDDQPRIDETLAALAGLATPGTALTSGR